MPRRRKAVRTVSGSSSPAASPVESPPPGKQMGGKDREDDLSAARGRFKGALKYAIEYNVDDSDSSFDHSLSKSRNWNDNKLSSQIKRNINDNSSDDEDSFSDKGKRSKKKFSKMHKNNSYVMKLFDRSVDLAQFTEDTPLYTICRAWMANKPRSNFKLNLENKKETFTEEGIKLPPPEGHPVSRVPPLLPEQCVRSKLNINLNYDDEPPVPIEALLKSHLTRWHAIRKKWLQQSIIYESRYAATQDMLNEMDTNS